MFNKENTNLINDPSKQTVNWSKLNIQPVCNCSNCSHSETCKFKEDMEARLKKIDDMALYDAVYIDDIIIRCKYFSKNQIYTGTGIR